MENNEKISIEIRELYDGIAVEFYPETKKFVWRDFILEKTTEEFRNNFENKICNYKK